MLFIVLLHLSSHSLSHGTRALDLSPGNILGVLAFSDMQFNLNKPLCVQFIVLPYGMIETV